ETLLRPVVQVSLQLPPGLVARRDDALPGRLELLLLLFPVGDLPDDHQELVVAAGRKARLVVASRAVELERVLDHARRPAVDRRTARLEHPVGEVVWKTIPDGEPDDLGMDQIAWIRRVVRGVRSVPR